MVDKNSQLLLDQDHRRPHEVYRPHISCCPV